MKNYTTKHFDFYDKNLSQEGKELLVEKYMGILNEIKLIQAYSDTSKDKLSDKKSATEDKIISTFKKYPELMYMTSYNPLRNSCHSLARDLLKADCSKAIEYMLRDNIAPTIQDHSGNNIGMLCAIEDNEPLVILSLENPRARKQTSHITKDNIGTFAAKKRMITATKKALQLNEMATHQNIDGDNIGMISARVMMGCPAMSECFELAGRNPDACMQFNNRHQNMFTIAEFSGYNVKKMREMFGDLYIKAIAEQREFDI